TEWRPVSLPEGSGWRGPSAGQWASSLDEAGYITAVSETRRRIAEGTVYQANICRVLSAPLPDGTTSLQSLAGLLAARHEAPFGGLIELPEAGVHVATASPELYLRRDGRDVASSPIKGTGR